MLSSSSALPLVASVVGLSTPTASGIAVPVPVAGVPGNAAANAGAAPPAPAAAGPAPLAIAPAQSPRPVAQGVNAYLHSLFEQVMSLSLAEGSGGGTNGNTGGDEAVDSDIEVVTLGRIFRLHRFLLRRNEFFRTRMAAPWRDQGRRVTLSFDSDFVTVDGFIAALRTIYCDVVPDAPRVLLPYMATCQQLQMSSACESLSFRELLVGAMQQIWLRAAQMASSNEVLHRLTVSWLETNLWELSQSADPETRAMVWQVPFELFEEILTNWKFWCPTEFDVYCLIRQYFAENYTHPQQAASSLTPVIARTPEGCAPDASDVMPPPSIPLHAQSVGMMTLPGPSPVMSPAAVPSPLAGHPASALATVQSASAPALAGATPPGPVLPGQPPPPPGVASGLPWAYIAATHDAHAAAAAAAAAAQSAYPLVSKSGVSLDYDEGDREARLDPADNPAVKGGAPCLSTIGLGSQTSLTQGLGQALLAQHNASVGTTASTVVGAAIPPPPTGPAVPPSTNLPTHMSPLPAGLALALDARERSLFRIVSLNAMTGLQLAVVIRDGMVSAEQLVKAYVELKRAVEGVGSQSHPIYMGMMGVREDVSPLIRGDIKEIVVFDGVWIAGSRWKLALKRRDTGQDEPSVGVYLTRLYSAPNSQGYWTRDPSRGHLIGLSMFLCRGGRYWKQYLIDNYNCTARKLYTSNREEEGSVSGSFGYPMVTFRDLQQDFGSILRCIVSIEHLR